MNKISFRQGVVVAVDDDSDFGQPIMMIFFFFFLYLISLEFILNLISLYFHLTNPCSTDVWVMGKQK